MELFRFSMYTTILVQIFGRFSFLKVQIYLIGNYNGNPNDDNIKSDGKPTDSTNELGESWQVPDDRPE